MEKATLQTFIKKYYLDGITGLNDATNLVGWKVQDGNLTVDYRMMGGVRIILDGKVDLKDGYFGIQRTDKMLQMINALDSEFTLNYNYSANKIVGIQFRDKSITANYGICDPSVIPEYPPIHELPGCKVLINLNKDTIKKFILAKKALPDAKVVGFVNGGGGSVDMVINYDVNNSNTVVVPFEAVTSDFDDVITFNVDYLVSIFNANLDFRTATLKVAENNAIQLDFVNEDCIGKYLIHSINLN